MSKIFCDVYVRRVGASGEMVIASGVSPNMAHEIIIGYNAKPGTIVARRDYTEAEHAAR